MKNVEVNDPISIAIQDLMNVFKKHFSSVTFPDVSFELLEGLIKKVDTTAKELQETLTRAETLREALDLNKTELLQKATRGLAYARIYAEGNDELLGELSKINLGKPVRLQKKSPQEKTHSTNEESKTEEKSDEKKPIKHARKNDDIKN
jgi:hypothetical protein